VLDAQVALFIKLFRKACETGDYYFVGVRRKNLEFLKKIGWTVEDVINYLYNNLSPEHYYKGPESDDNPIYEPGVIFAFIIPIENFSVYVKLKKQEGGNYFIILSFHEEGRR